jgi:hypothetical protein|tara:strand:+ start:263 stop:658 length:396 start_codon:yes stop_codon:yes gene_type:complete
MVLLDVNVNQTVRGVKMLKALFNQGYSKKFMDRIEFRREEYYKKRRIQTIRDNAMKMAMNWSHEYPTGTPLEYIRDDIIECWERNSKVGIFEHIDKKQQIPTPSAVQLQWTGVHAIDEIPYKIEGEHEKNN